MREKNAVSIFSGIDAMGLAAESAGFNTLVAVENNEHAIKSLRALHPGVTIIDKDICEIDETDIYNAAGTDDICLLYGGWPCQGNSVAGGRAGLADDRSGLFYEFARLVGALLPDWVVGENVEGLLSVKDKDDPEARAGDDYSAVQDELAYLGYSVGWASWRACDIPDACGDPFWHRRKRVFTLARLASGAKGADSSARAGHSRWQDLAAHVRDGGWEADHPAVKVHTRPRGSRRNGPPEQLLQERVAEVLQRLYGRGRDLRHREGRGVGGTPKTPKDQGLRGLPLHQPIPGPSDLVGWMEALDRDLSLRPSHTAESEAEHGFHGWAHGTSSKELHRQIGNALMPGQVWLVFQIAAILLDDK